MWLWTKAVRLARAMFESNLVRAGVICATQDPENEHLRSLNNGLCVPR